MTERDIFLEALEIPTQEARVAFLQGACGGDAALRRKVDELLKEHYSDDSLLAGPALEVERNAETVPPAPEAPAQMIGRYKLLEKIGEGGFGEVWMAEQREPVKRRVALKIIKLGMDSRQIVARFEAERQALAMMDHANIARIFDADVAKNGRLYFVMELVRGIKITEYCDQNKLPTRERLDLFIKVCQAIQHAHQKGIIHRDIKPSNILVTLHDGVPVPKVIDFGIAKATQGELTDKTVFTQFQQFIGTPAYISPEQAEMSGLDIDTRADIYSLGVLLYELLVGQTPFDAKEMMQGGIDALRQIIREKEPLRPSTKLNTLQGDARTTAGKRRQTDVGKLVHQLEGDLDWIVMKCLEKDRTRRYDTANGLAADIQRHLNHEPVAARPPSTAYRFQKAFRRNKLVFSAATAVAVALVAGFGVSTWQLVDARRARNGEQQQRFEAESAQKIAETERQRAEQNAGDLVKRLYVADMRTAWESLQEDNLGVAREAIYKYLPALGIRVASELKESSGGLLPAGAVTRDLLGWEWRRLWALSQSEELFTLHGDGLEIRCVVFSPDSRLVATGRGRTVFITDAQTKKQLTALNGFSGIIDNSGIAFSNDGRYLVAKGGTNVIIWEVGHWSVPYKQLQGAENKHHGNAVVFSPDDRRLVTLVEGGLGVWDTTTWQKQLVAGSFGFGMYLRYTADGKWLAASEWKELKILNAESLEVEWVFPREQDGNFVMFALDSCRNLLAAGYLDGIVRFWETTSHPRSWREVARFQPHPSFTFGLAFSPDGSVVATGGSDQLIKVWDVTKLTNNMAATAPPKPLRKLRGNRAMSFPGRLPPKDGPQPITTLRGHHAAIHGLSFAPDGKSIVSASKDGTAKFWNPFPEVKSDSLPDSRYLAWFAPDGTRLITVNYDSYMHHWDTRNRKDLGAIGPNLDNSKAWTVSEDGKMLAVGWENGEVEIWSIESNQKLKSLSHVDSRIAHLAFSSDALLIAAASERASEANEQPTLRIWESASGAIAGTYSNAYGPLAFSSDKQRLVSTRLDGTVVVWDLADGSSAAEIGENFTWIGDLTLSPDGRLLVTGSEEPVVNISDLATGKRIYSLEGSGMCVVGVAFTPDAKTLASRTVDGVMRFWHGSTRKEMFTLGPLDGVNSFLFSPNGEYLAISRGEEERGEQRMLLWRAPSFEEIIAAENEKARKNENRGE